MIFSELLKSQGLTEEQVQEILREMKRNRIYITLEEKIEERYKKMKLQRDNLQARVQSAEESLRELNKSLLDIDNFVITSERPNNPDCKKSNKRSSIYE